MPSGGRLSAFNTKIINFASNEPFLAPLVDEAESAQSPPPHQIKRMSWGRGCVRGGVGISDEKENSKAAWRIRRLVEWGGWGLYLLAWYSRGKSKKHFKKLLALNQKEKRKFRKHKTRRVDTCVKHSMERRSGVGMTADNSNRRRYTNRKFKATTLARNHDNGLTHRIEKEISDD